MIVSQTCKEITKSSQKHTRFNNSNEKKRNTYVSDYSINELGIR